MCGEREVIFLGNSFRNWSAAIQEFGVEQRNVCKCLSIDNREALEQVGEDISDNAVSICARRAASADMVANKGVKSGRVER